MCGQFCMIFPSNLSVASSMFLPSFPHAGLGSCTVLLNELHIHVIALYHFVETRSQAKLDNNLLSWVGSTSGVCWHDA